MRQTKEAHRDYVREWYKKLRLKNPNWSIERNARQRAEIIYRLGGRCANCGIEDPRVLEAHHINNDGYLDRGKNSGNAAGKLLSLIRKAPERFQLLCANCHKIKTWENNHERK
jgi:hypothetical protein